MKRNIKSLIGFTMGATDGTIGEVTDFYFDDQTWTVRYLVVETGSWLSGRKVLISTEALHQTDWDNQVFPVNLTIDQVKSSPDIDTEQPVSRQQEMELYDHYPWTNYWTGGLWGAGIGTTGMMVGPMIPFEDAIKESVHHGDHHQPHHSSSHLRSCQQMKGYNIVETDGEIGDVKDFIVDDASWQIDYLVVDTGNWFPGKKVLISPQWINDIDWMMSRLTVNVTKQQVKDSPEYHHDQIVTDEYHSGLHSHYGYDRNS